MENIKEEKQNESVAFLDRTSRPTRGKRMTRLLDDEVEDDEVFWNQEALKEDEIDDEYEEEEGEAADVFDSDFDEDEPDPDEGAEIEPTDREQPKKRLICPGKALAKKKRKTKVLSKVNQLSTSENVPEHSEHHPTDVPDDIEAEKVIRKSTRTAVVVKQAERDAIRASLQATTRPPIKRKKEGEEKRMTQEEMILEAAQTELMNLRNLERVLAREEEVKKRAVVHKAVFNGPQIRYLSKDGCSYLEYLNGASFESEIMTKSPPYPEKGVCVVTGLPAKYRDPKTGLPYATKEAFKIIRNQLSNQSSNISEKQSIGPLGDDIKGFCKRQKRTIHRKNRDSSNSRTHARFRRFPDSDMEDSE